MSIHKNPRDKVPENKYCAYEYPPDHPRKGEKCMAVKMKGSIYCYFHQPNQDKVRKQLAEARESRKGFPNEKHGFYTQTQKECDDCALSGGCKYFEAGKKVCDYQANPTNIDLTSLDSIQKYAEDILKTELKRYKKLEPVFEQPENFDNMDLFNLSSIVGKRITSMLKDYAAIKEIYEKRQKIGGWKDILKSDNQ